ncbi:hypothetical protein [Rhodobacter sp. KR11]|jgi:hypothetical protein|uniref:hypothetical protein n=1 Tax=Rhodobacter sp. KR11 TaxID=2974588 RepID=UPI002222E886|nr:hypothetical protein [Rhodobacter sp. KR11]
MGRSAVRVYELSAQNRILSVSDNWDPFARTNGGADALSHAVLGRPIWDFVSGLDTRSYLNALIFATRNAGRKVSVRYRCDGLAERRLFQLQIEPLEDNAVRLSHLPLEIRSRRKPASAPPPGAQVCCGQCLRWRQGSTWEEAEIHHALAPQGIDFVVCPQCRTEAQRVIDALGCLRAVH